MSPSAGRRPSPREGRAWRGYAGVAALALVAGAVLAILLSSHGGGGAGSGPTASASPVTRTATPAPVRPTSRAPRTRHLVFADGGLRLPAPRQSAAAVMLAAGQVLLAGGLDGAGKPSAGVLRVTATEAGRAGRLPRPLAEAAGTSVSGTAYVFGGGGSTPTADILRVDPSGTAQKVDSLPKPVTGAGAAAVGGNAYVVGGFDGRTYLTSIVAWQPGVGVHIVASLPVGLRDPAVVAVGGQLVIAGGTTPKGPSRALFGFDPVTGQVTGITPLPAGLTRARGVVVGGRVYLLGGEGSGGQGTQTDAILEYDPVTAHVTPAGRLPTPLSDAGAAVVGGQVILAGGIDDSGRVHDEVWLGTLRG